MSPQAEQIKVYLQRNWFKLGIAALLIFVALKKDLSFKLNLNTPVKIEQAPEAPSTEKAAKRERYTDNLTSTSSADQTEHFDLAAAARSPKKITASDRLQRTGKAQVQEYIDRFDQVAKSEERKFGIPAAIIMANALLHSQAGTAPWAEKGRNNHFLLPCTEDWKGRQKSYDSRCLRQYENAWTSFRDHSFFITTGPYSDLKTLQADDIRGWATALEAKGFSEEPALAQQLLEVIRLYGL
ncbi:MAG: glucosaminidase domain-containing protein [Phaeodactylibacter sp.]|uniref:glucosaminidase domain-containing protein n=1 Tax=Phaeodactylibacter sp. TaxID=1940289 RepID=UPI0032EEEEC8